MSVEKQAISDHSHVCVTSVGEKRKKSFLKFNTSAGKIIPKKLKNRAKEN